MPNIFGMFTKEKLSKKFIETAIREAEAARDNNVPTDEEIQKVLDYLNGSLEVEYNMSQEAWGMHHETTIISRNSIRELIHSHAGIGRGHYKTSLLRFIPPKETGERKKADKREEALEKLEEAKKKITEAQEEIKQAESIL